MAGCLRGRTSGDFLKRLPSRELSPVTKDNGVLSKSPTSATESTASASPDQCKQVTRGRQKKFWGRARYHVPGTLHSDNAVPPRGGAVSLWLSKTLTSSESFCPSPTRLRPTPTRFPEPIITSTASLALRSGEPTHSTISRPHSVSPRSRIDDRPLFCLS